MSWVSLNDIVPRNRCEGALVYRDEDGDYVLTRGGYEYLIEKERISEPAALVKWVVAMAMKTWSTKEDLEKLILLVVEDFPDCIDRNA